jgi:hypothetical protein
MDEMKETEQSSVGEMHTKPNILVEENEENHNF